MYIKMLYQFLVLYFYKYIFVIQKFYLVTHKSQNFSMGLQCGKRCGKTTQDGHEALDGRT